MFKDWLYSAHAWAARPGKKRTRRRTERGQLILTGAVFAAVLGLNTDRSLIYQLFALFFCLLIAARFGLALNRPTVSVARILPRYATAGTNFTYQIRVTNEGDDIESDLTIVDTLTTKPPSREQYQFNKEPDEDSRNAWDRFIGFHRFIYLQRLNTGLTTKPADVPEIGIKASVKADIEAVPLRRGIVSFDSIDVMHKDPFSLNYGIQRFSMQETLLVLPKRYSINKNRLFTGGRNFQPGGISSAWSIGESDEFVSLRDYRDGDPLRKIHWASSAKRKKPVVREYQDEYYVRNALLLDVSNPQLQIIEEAISVAASYSLAMDDSDSMLDLIYLSDKPKVITTGRGTSSINEHLEALATLQRSNASIDLLTQAFLRHRKLVSGCIVVLSAYDPPHKDLIKRVKTSGLNMEACIVVEENNPDIPRDIKQLRVDHIEEDLRNP